ncbi:Hypothetical protein AJF4211_000030 [Avibacterium paragallinarum JF4211]|nr:Hypothetical protein AJF4211_000030 [Avibacterium paragallinarum JF4211]
MDIADDCLNEALALWDRYIDGEVQQEYEAIKAIELAEGETVETLSADCISPLDCLELIVMDLDEAMRYIKHVRPILKKLIKAQRKHPEQTIKEVMWGTMGQAD